MGLEDYAERQFNPGEERFKAGIGSDGRRGWAGVESPKLFRMLVTL
jgi:hypothetical protein